jgi:hypothetical protein
MMHGQQNISFLQIAHVKIGFVNTVLIYAILKCLNLAKF